MSENALQPVFGRTEIGDTFTSIQGGEMAAKIQLYNAVNNPDHRLKDYINNTINVRDVVVKAVTLKGDGYESAGTAGRDWTEDRDREGFRVVLIDVNGESYTATSNGIYNSVSTIFSIFGTLHFDSGLPVQVKQVSTKRGNTLTLRIVSE